MQSGLAPAAGPDGHSRGWSSSRRRALPEGLPEKRTSFTNPRSDRFAITSSALPAHSGVALLASCLLIRLSFDPAGPALCSRSKAALWRRGLEARVVLTLVRHDGPGRARQLVRHRNDHHVERPPGQQLHDPRRRVFPRHHRSCAVDQQAAQVRIAPLAYMDASRVASKYLKF